MSEKHPKPLPFPSGNGGDKIIDDIIKAGVHEVAKKTGDTPTEILRDLQKDVEDTQDVITTEATKKALEKLQGS